MDRKDFEKALAGGSLPSVLLFEGEEEQMKQDALSSLRKTLLPAGMEEMNEMVLDDPETDQLIAAAAPGFLSPLGSPDGCPALLLHRKAGCAKKALYNRQEAGRDRQFQPPCRSRTDKVCDRRVSRSRKRV